jgi:hypothetical protein
MIEGQFATGTTHAARIRTGSAHATSAEVASAMPTRASSNLGDRIFVAKAGASIHRFCFAMLGEIMVAKAGIEPATHGFSVRCSTN